jgi:hypothetical protein
MAVAAPTPIRPSRYSTDIAAESHMEAAEAARRVLVFAEDELRASFQTGDVARLRRLQTVHRDAKTILAEHRRQAGWHDAQCSDGVKAPGHGRAA